MIELKTKNDKKLNAGNRLDSLKIHDLAMCLCPFLCCFGFLFACLFI